MNMICKTLKKCDKTIMIKHGFDLKDDMLYRLHGRILQTFWFDRSHVCPSCFRIYVGIAPLSEKLWYGGGGFELQDFTGNRELPYWFDYDSKNQESSNKVFEGALSMLEQLALPTMDKITDENSLIDVGESISGEAGKWFHCITDARYDIYALAGRFEYVVKYLEFYLKDRKKGLRKEYEHFIKEESPEKAMEMLDNYDYAIPSIKKDLAAAKRGDIEYFKKSAAAIEERNREYLWLKYKIGAKKPLGGA